MVFGKDNTVHQYSRFPNFYLGVVYTDKDYLLKLDRTSKENIILSDIEILIWIC